MKKLFVVVLSTFITFVFPCTIAVISGEATSTGKPIIWKNRDYLNHKTNILVKVQGDRYDYTGIASTEAPDYIAMGVNSEGFAIGNSLSLDMPEPLHDNIFNNIDLMKYALGNFSSADEFEEFLLSTNDSNFRSTRGNFAVVDANQNAILYEVSPTQFFKFDANNLETSPNNYVIRTNYSSMGMGLNGYDRWLRANDLFDYYYSNMNLSPLSIMNDLSRDFSYANSDEIPIPFLGNWDNYTPAGYINTNFSINNKATVSSMIVEGVDSYDNRKYTTMWTALGNPSSTVFIPIWDCNNLSEDLTSEIEDSVIFWSKKIKDKLYDYPLNYNYLQSQYFDTSDYDFINILNNFESQTYLKAKNSLSNTPNKNSMQQLQDEILSSALETLASCFASMQVNNNDIESVQNNINVYPNPIFLHKTNRLNIESSRSHDITKVSLFDIKGRLIKTTNKKILSLENINASGIYFVKISSGTNHVSTKKITIIK